MFDYISIVPIYSESKKMYSIQLNYIIYLWGIVSTESIGIIIFFQWLQILMQTRTVSTNLKLVRPVRGLERHLHTPSIIVTLIPLVYEELGIVMRFCDAASHSTEL